MSGEGPGLIVIAVKRLVPAKLGDTTLPAVHTPAGLAQSGPSANVLTIVVRTGTQRSACAPEAISATRTVARMAVLERAGRTKKGVVPPTGKRARHPCRTPLQM